MGSCEAMQSKDVTSVAATKGILLSMLPNRLTRRWTDIPDLTSRLKEANLTWLACNPDSTTEFEDPLKDLAKLEHHLETSRAAATHQSA